MSDPIAATPPARPCPSWGAMTLASLLTKLAHSRRDDVFVSVENGGSLTFREAQLQVRMLSQFFNEQGLNVGDCTLIRQGRQIDGLIALLACARAGLDACIVPEGMSARDVVEGAAPLTPKLVLDAGRRNHARTMEMAAGLFTVRLVCGFGHGQADTLADGMVGCSPPELAKLGLGKQGIAEPAKLDPERDGLVHYLRSGTSDRVERMTRTQSHVLSQALANAMMMHLTTGSAIGTAYDPLGANGLMMVMAPAIVVGTSVRLFDGLNPDIAKTMGNWSADTHNGVTIMPLSLRENTYLPRAKRGLKSIWLAPTMPKLAEGAAPLGTNELLAVDLGGVAFAHAINVDEKSFGVVSGPIEIAGNSGQAMTFGTVGLRAVAKENNHTETLLSGEITVEGSVAARRDGHIWETQRTGMMARAIDRDSGTPLFALSESIRDMRVGGQHVSLAKINRCLMLTGRWQDAAAYSISDPMVGVRLEVAVQPRLNDEGEAIRGDMPKLDDVRGLLQDSGISDAMLPTIMYLVTSVPRGLSGDVVVEELADKLIEFTDTDAETDTDTETDTDNVDVRDETNEPHHAAA